MLLIVFLVILALVAVIAASVGALGAVGLAVSYPLFWLARSAGLSGDEGAIRAGTITWVIVAVLATVLLLWIGVPRGVGATSWGVVAGQFIVGLLIGFALGNALAAALADGQAVAAHQLFGVPEAEADAMFGYGGTNASLAALVQMAFWFGIPMALASRSVQASSGGSVALWRRQDGAASASMPTPGYSGGRDDATTAIWLTLLSPLCLLTLLLAPVFSVRALRSAGSTTRTRRRAVFSLCLTALVTGLWVALFVAVSR